MKRITRILPLASLLIALALFFAPETDTSAAQKSNSTYEKVVKYIQANEKDLAYSYLGKGVQIDTNISLIYDSANNCIIARRNDDDGYDYDMVEITFYLDKPYKEIKLSWESYSSSPVHWLSDKTITEHLYTSAGSKRYKYLSNWYYAENGGLSSEDDSVCDPSVLSCAEENFTELMKTVSSFLKKKAGITFTPIVAFDKYKDIDAPYYEPKTETIYKKYMKNFCISENDLLGMQNKDIKVIRTKYDLDGDGTKDTISFIVTCTNSEYGTFHVALKVNKEKIDLGTIELYDTPFFSTNILDVNPKDKYKELRICTSYYIDSAYDVYRYTGKKLYKIHKYYTGSFELRKQNANDYLQGKTTFYDTVMGDIYVTGSFKYSEGREVLVRNKTGIHSATGNNVCEFNRTVSLYKSPDNNTIVSTIYNHDQGKIAKVKIDENQRITYIYVECQNGKKGWIKNTSVDWYDDFIIYNASYGG